MIDLTNNCVAQYKMNDNEASIVVLNATGGPHGTSVRNTSAMHTAGMNDGAFSFNGSSDFIEVPSSDLFDFPSNEFTVCFWMRTTSNSAVIAGRQALTWIIDITDGQVGYVGFATGIVPVVINDGQWRFFAFTVKPGEWICHINGAVVDTGVADTMPYSEDTYPIRIGADNKEPQGQFLNGALDNLCIFDKALSAQEVAFLYNGGAGTELLVQHVKNNPFGPWRFGCD